MRPCGRFAPSITGQAHPGTLLSALLAWLDARRLGGRVVLRLEDLDHTRLREGDRESMVRALEWLGLDWDETVRQSECAAEHEAALDALAKAGALYPCACSRAQIRAIGRRGPDGGFAYDNRCRGRCLPEGGWRECTEPLRVHLPDGDIDIDDESGLPLGHDPAATMGDPIVRRRDGVIAYQLVVVVDDARAGVNRVVRGRDIASSTPTQVALLELLGLEVPTYRHHFLLLEERGEKMAKMHGSMPFDELESMFLGEELCGVLAQIAGIHPTGDPVTPHDLVSRFAWDKVRQEDLLFAASNEAHENKEH